MSKKFKKTLFGYNPALVDKEFEHINAEFEREHRLLMEEFKSLQIQNDDIKAKIAEIDGSVVSITSIETEIGKMLVKAHLEVSSEMYNVIKRYKSMEKGKIKIIDEYRKRCEGLEDEIREAMGSVQSMANM